MASLENQKDDDDQVECQKTYLTHLGKFCAYLVEDFKNDFSRIKALLSLIPSGISITTDKTCKEIIHNPVAAKFLRIDEWESFSLSADIPPPVKLYNDGQEMTLEQLPMQRSVWFGETTENMEIEFIWEDGVKKASLWSSSPLKDEQGAIIGAIAAFKDITRNKSLEKEILLHKEKLLELVRERTDELYLVNEKLHTILNSITDAFCAMDKYWVITYLNNAAERIFGFPRDQVIGKCIWDLYPKFKETLIYRELMRAAEEKISINVEDKNIYTRQWFEYHVFPSREGVTVYFSDITAKKKIEQEMKASRERFSTVFKSSPLMMSIIKLDGFIYLDVNKSWEQTVGYKKEEILGKTPDDINLWQREMKYLDIREDIKKGHMANYESILTTKEGKGIHILGSSDIIEINGEKCILTILNDITERKKIEMEMSRLERLNLVGEMAAGFGHEIRNPMTTVRGFLQMFEKNEELSKYKDIFILLIDELDRANSIITEYLSLAKNRAGEFRLQDLNQIIKNLAPLMESDGKLVDKHLEIELQETPLLLLDEKDIRQLIINLVRNGFEVTPPSGTLLLRTYRRENEVFFSVRDQGLGIPPEIRDKIGTPFFTTKDNGTGLGLAVCYTIASRHKAALDYETDNKGTVFIVRFKIPEA
ncbi:MAG: PAS domain-containing protein [Bacillota bacterium]